jgi:hypothetical protein
MKRKRYEKATMTIVKQHQGMMLLQASSGVESKRLGYGSAVQQTWGGQTLSLRQRLG